VTIVSKLKVVLSEKGNKDRKINKEKHKKNSVADPGFGAFLTSGSGIRIQDG
jgi:hypothetical protein